MKKHILIDSLEVSLSRGENNLHNGGPFHYLEYQPNKVKTTIK